MKKRRTIAVEEYTTPSPEYCSPETSLKYVALKMNEGGFRHMPVVERHEVVGMVSKRELSVALQVGADENMAVKDIMKETPYTTSPKTNIEDVVFEMSKHKIGSAIVIDKESDYLGIFTSTDAMNAMIEIIRGETE